MGTVLSGRRGYHGGKPLTRDLPSVSLVRRVVDIARPGRPLLLVEGNRAIVMHGEFVLAAEVATSPCHMGGVRRWLVCPGCRIRRQTLYIAAMRLICRECANLRYPTQAMNRRYRAIEKADGIRCRLGWEPGALRPWGGRPKRMRLTTYWRLVDALQAVESKLLPDLAAWAERAVRTINPQVPPGRSPVAPSI
jgi:hypothetical protein